MKIRLAELEDEPAIKACAQAAYQKYIHAIGQTPAPMLANFGTQISQGIVHVAINGKNLLLGYIVFFIKNNHMCIESIAVHPQHSGQGIGKMLISECERFARQARAQSIQLYTNEKMTDNLAIYPHLGFENMGNRTQDGFNRVYFEKPLN